MGSPSLDRSLGFNVPDIDVPDIDVFELYEYGEEFEQPEEYNQVSNVSRSIFEIMGLQTAYCNLKKAYVSIKKKAQRIFVDKSKSQERLVDFDSCDDFKLLQDELKAFEYMISYVGDSKDNVFLDILMEDFCKKFSLSKEDFIRSIELGLQGRDMYSAVLQAQFPDVLDIEELDSSQAKSLLEELDEDFLDTDEACGRVLQFLSKQKRARLNQEAFKTNSVSLIYGGF